MFPSPVRTGSAVGLACLCAALVAQGAEVRLSTYFPLGQNDPRVSAFGSTVVSVWQEPSRRNGAGWGYSLDDGRTWTAAGEMPLIQTTDSYQGQPSICVDASGRFYSSAIYRNQGYSIGVCRSRMDNGAIGWDPPVLAVPQEGPTSSGVQRYQAPHLACDPSRGYLYLVYTYAFLNADPNVSQNTVFITRSLDGGLTWSAPRALDTYESHGPQAAVGPDGELYVIWEDYQLGEVRGVKSLDFGETFSAPFTVGTVRDNLGARPPGYSPPYSLGSPLYPYGHRFAPDFPAMAINCTGGSRRGEVYVAWCDYAEGVPAAPSGNIVNAYDPNEHYASATPIEFGDTIYGDMLGEDSPGYEKVETLAFDGVAGTTLWLDGEVTFNSFYSPSLLDFSLLTGPDTLSLRRVAETRVTGPGLPLMPPMIVTLPVSGRYYLRAIGGGVESRDYRLTLSTLTVDAGSVARDHRDIVLVRSSDSGASWSSKVRVNDSPPRFDDCMPVLVVDELGGLDVAWYDRRDDVTWGSLAHTYWTRSDDGGRTFQPSVRISSTAGTWQYGDGAGTGSVGARLGLAASGDRVHVVWTQQGRPDWDIFASSFPLEPPTGIAVSGLAVHLEGSEVHLSWQVHRAEGIRGFLVHRARGGSGEFEPLEQSPLPVLGEREHLETDTPPAPGFYRYRLEIVNRDGTSDWEGPVTLEVPQTPTRLAWVSAAPNPFGQQVRLELRVARTGEAQVITYDLGGHEVAVLHRGRLEAGRHAFEWTGKNRAGRTVPAGVYWLKASAGGETATMRVVKLR